MRETAPEKRPAYATIASSIRDGIAQGSLAPGTVLLEGPLAELFGSSRAPVKQALAMLHEEGRLERFSGRGLIVAGAEPLRVALTAEAVGLEGQGAGPVKSFAWETFYYDFEREITLRSTLGRARINELALARHYGVGRTVARDLLVHAQLAGLVEKGEDSRWWIVGLDEQRFADLYELRLLLEPAALATAIDNVPPDVLDSFQARLTEAERRFPEVDQAELDRLENDLHIECLSFSRNAELLEALRRARSTLITGKHIQTALGRTPKIDPFMEEHLAILSAVRAGKASEASGLLLSHLESSSTKAQERLALFRKRRPPAIGAYVTA